MSAKIIGDFSVKRNVFKFFATLSTLAKFKEVI